MRILVLRKKAKVRSLLAGLVVSALLTGCGSGEENKKNESKKSPLQMEQSASATEQLSIDNEKATNETKNAEKNEIKNAEKNETTINESTENIIEGETSEASSELQSEPLTADESATEQEKISEYVEMLRNFAESGEWKNHCVIYEGDGVEPSQCSELQYSIFDIDRNGIPEMLVYAEEPHMSSNYMSMSCFCVIENEKISVALSGNTTDGSIGGSKVSMVCKTDTGELQIASNRHVGGFGGKMFENNYYSYHNGSLEKELCIESTTYFNLNNGENEYLVDGVAVTSDELDLHIASYKWINICQISSYTEVY